MPGSAWMPRMALSWLAEASVERYTSLCTWLKISHEAVIAGMLIGLVYVCSPETIIGIF